MAQDNAAGDVRVAGALRAAFPGLGEVELSALLEDVEIHTYPPDTILTYEGRVEHTFYIVLDGRALITARMPDGGDRLLAERVAGQFFGEMALIENKPRTATVKTATETTVIEISEQLFDEMLEDNASVAFAVLRELTANLRSSDQAAIADLSRKNLELEQAYRDLKEAQDELVAKERLERELEIAGEVQRSLLPDTFPDVEGWSFAGKNVPARVVGGDLFDVMQLDDEHVGLLLADVSDKSVHAALFMGVTRALFHSESKRRLSPAETTLAVHEAIFQVSTNQEMFVTAFYGVLHAPSGRLCYVRAGQDLPLLVPAAGGDPVELDAAGRFIGMIEELELEEREIEVGAGDLLVVYSDGVPDAVDAEELPYGTERLRNLVCDRRSQTAAEVCTAVFDDVMKYRGSAAAADDITLLIVKSTR
ncbi:MAG: PP2C family protein-serine/threonine phosphatase [Anaerolineales bacterium]